MRGVKSLFKTGIELILCDSEEIKYAVQVIRAVVFNLDVTLLFGVVDLDAGGESVGEEVLDALNGWSRFSGHSSAVAAWSGDAGIRQFLRGHFFCDPHGEGSPHDLVGEPFLFTVVFQ